MSMIVNPYAASATVADPNFANVAFVSHCESIVSANLIYVSGNGFSGSFATSGSTPPSIDASNPLFGAGSLAFSNGKVSASNGAAVVVGTQDYTVEGAFRTASPSQAIGCLYDARSVAGIATDPYMIPVVQAGSFMFEIKGQTDVNGGTILTNTWQRWAYCRAGTTGYCFVDGTLQGTTTDAQNYSASTVPSFGQTVNALVPIVGNMDELRLTIGVARYTTNYTLASGPFPDS